MPDTTTKTTSSKPSSAGKSKPVAIASEPVAAELTGTPRLADDYIAVTCLKYASGGNGKTINAKPGDILGDLSKKDIAKFRLSGAIKILIEG